MRNFLDFEKPIADLEAKIEELRHLANGDTVNITEEIARLEAKANRLLRQTYTRLSAWQKVQVARHPQRPHGTDYIAALIEDFTPLAGDRNFGEDAAVLGGLGRFQGQTCVILAQEKGQDMASRLKHNFGMPKPEGYRKAVRLLGLAERFSLPVITFVDTAGAFPGIEAEARGQAEAIARAIDACLAAPVPIVATIIGEGGSGGAIALATANCVNMLEHSIYSVISPEGCASILWRSADKAQEAAEALRITAQDLEKLGVIDRVIAEPLGGGHRDPETLIANVGKAIEAQLKPLMLLDAVGLKQQRREKYLTMGQKGL